MVAYGVVVFFDAAVCRAPDGFDLLAAYGAYGDVEAHGGLVSV
jgi:hypothetical protein